MESCYFPQQVIFTELKANYGYMNVIDTLEGHEALDILTKQTWLKLNLKNSNVH